MIWILLALIAAPYLLGAVYAYQAVLQDTRDHPELQPHGRRTALWAGVIWPWIWWRYR